VSELAVTVEDINQFKKKMSFEIPWGFVKDELDHVYRDLGKKAKIKGFRPGKVPRKVLENYFKADAEGEAITNIVNKYYWQELDNRGLVALSQPEIEQNGLKEDSDFCFSAAFETEPDFDPQGYVGVELEKVSYSVSEEDMDKRLQEIRKTFATMEEVEDDRPAAMGDFARIDFSGTLDGEALPELNSENYLLELGSKMFVPGFEEEVAGMKKGETKSFHVTFPDDYSGKKVAGREVAFAVTCKSLQEQKLPEINEEFIKNFEKYNTLEELRNDVRSMLEEQCRRKGDTEFHDAMIDVILKANEFAAPPSLVERQIFYMVTDLQKRMRAAGMDEQSAMEFSFRMHDQFRQEAEKTVKTYIIIKKIAQKEGLAVSDTDIDDHIGKIAELHHTDFQNVKIAYENPDRLDALKSEIIQKKVFDLIERQANITVIEKEGIKKEEAS